jgi:hypothetical protein
MRSNLSLLTSAAVLAFGLTATAALAENPKGDAPGAKSDITIVTDDTGNAPSGAEGQTAPDQGSAMAPDSGDGGAAAQATPPAGDEGGATAQGSAEDQGAAGTPPIKEGKIPSPSSSY